jgi:hypothetical protein
MWFVHHFSSAPKVPVLGSHPSPAEDLSSNHLAYSYFSEFHLYLKCFLTYPLWVLPLGAQAPVKPVASIGLFLAYLAENLGVLFVPECRPLPHLFQFDQLENSHEVNCKPYAVLE